MSSHFTAEVASTSSAKPQRRRQNTSCDPCRRSKRRCFFPPADEDGSGTACMHCRRLGHACTFDFATSQLNSRPKKRQRRNQPRHNQSAGYAEKSGFDKASETPVSAIGDTFQHSFTNDQEDFTSWLNFDVSRYFDDISASLPEDTYTSATLSPSCLDLSTIPEPRREERVALVPNRSHTTPSALSLAAGQLVGSTLRSPVYLLTSKLDATVIDERLARIYEAIVTGSASRFLDYDSNLYATGFRYQIENSSAEVSQESSPAGMSVILNEKTADFPTSIPQPTDSPLPSGGSFTQSHFNGSKHDTVPVDTFRMTLLGCIRFLDHFSDLYGNRLSPVARRQSDRALKAVLRTFSLQWLLSSRSSLEPGASLDLSSTGSLNGEPLSSNSLLEIYTDAWFRARSILRDVHSVRSFRVVCAIFMFDGIAIPKKAHDALNEPNLVHEFLDMGLGKLRELDGLVKQYCDNLGPFSQYGALLEASLSLVRWCGYIRDIGAALTTNYQCKLPELSVHSDGQ